MKGLYKLAVAFEKASQVPSMDMIRNISEKGPFGGAFSAPQPTPIDPFVQKSLNDLGYKPELIPDGKLGDKTKNALEWFRDTYKLPPAISPDLIQKQVMNEAAKLQGKPSAMLAVKAPGVPEAKPKGLADTSGLDSGGPGFVGPNHFVDTVR